MQSEGKRRRIHKESRKRIGRHRRWKLDNFILKTWLEIQDRRSIKLRKLKDDLEARGLSQSNVHRGLVQLFSSPMVHLRRSSDLESCWNRRSDKRCGKFSKIADSNEMLNSNDDGFPELSAEKVGSDTCNGRFNKMKHIKVNLSSSQNRNGKRMEICSQTIDTELRKADSSVSEDVGKPISVIISTGTEVTCTSTTDTMFQKIPTFITTNNVTLPSVDKSYIEDNVRKRKFADTMATPRAEKKLRKELISSATKSQQRVSTVGNKGRLRRETQEQRLDKGKSLKKSSTRSTKRNDQPADSNRPCSGKLQVEERKRKRDWRRALSRNRNKLQEKFKELFGNDSDDENKEYNLLIRKWEEKLMRPKKVRVKRNDTVKENSLSITEVKESPEKQKDYSVKDTSSFADRISLKIAKTTSELCRMEKVPPCANDTLISSKNRLEVSKDNDIDLKNLRKSSKDKSLGVEASKKMKRPRTPDIRIKESCHEDKRKVESDTSMPNDRHKARKKRISSKIHNESSKSRKARADSTNLASKVSPVIKRTYVNDISRVTSVEEISRVDKTLFGATESIARFTDLNEVDFAFGEKNGNHPNEMNSISKEVAVPILPDSSTSPLYPCLTCELGSQPSNFKYTKPRKSRGNCEPRNVSRTNDNSDLCEDVNASLAVDGNYVSSVVVASPQSTTAVSTIKEEVKDNTETDGTAPDSSVIIECNVENMPESRSDSEGNERDVEEKSRFPQDMSRSVSSNSEKTIVIDVPCKFPKSEPVDAEEIKLMKSEKPETVESDIVNLAAPEISPNYDESLDKSSETDFNTNCVTSANANSSENYSMDSNGNFTLPTAESPKGQVVPRIRVKDAQELGGVRWCPTPVHVPNVEPIDLQNGTSTQPKKLRTLLPNSQKPIDGTSTAVQLTFHPAANINPMSIRQNSISNQAPAVQREISPTYVLLQVENVQQFIPYQNCLVKQPTVEENLNQISAPQSIPVSVVRQTNDNTDLVSQQNSYVHGHTQTLIQQLQQEQQPQQQLQLQQRQLQQQQQMQQKLQLRQKQKQQKLQQKQQELHQQQKQLQQQQRLQKKQQKLQQQQLQQQQSLQVVQLILDKVFLSLVRIRQLLEREKIIIQFSMQLRQEECQEVKREFSVSFQTLALELGNLKMFMKMGTIEQLLACVVTAMNVRLAYGMLPFTVNEIQQIINHNIEANSYPVSCNDNTPSKEANPVEAQQQTMDYASYSKYILENQLIPFGQLSIFTEIQKIILNKQIMQYRILAVRIQKQLEQLKEAEEAGQRDLGIAHQDREDSGKVKATKTKDLKDQNKKVQMQESLTLQQNQLKLHKLLRVQEIEVEVEAQELPTNVVVSATTENSTFLKKELNSDVSDIVQERNDEIEILSMTKDIDSYAKNLGSPDLEIVFDKRYQRSVLVNGKNARTDIFQEDETSEMEKLNVKLTNEATLMESEELKNKKTGKTELSNMNIRSVSPVEYANLRSSITTPSPLDFASLEEMRVINGAQMYEDEDADNDVEMKICLLCTKPSAVACGRCYEAKYCSAKCAQIHWRKYHHQNCEPPKADDPRYILKYI